MTNNDKHVKWHNDVQNHQNGELLPVLDTQIEDVRDKLESLVIKLQEMHGKDKFSLFTEKGKKIKIKIIPAKAAEVYGLFDYTVR
eukprot:7569923-Ditylum_brightwellii.AAC.1